MIEEIFAYRIARARFSDEVENQVRELLSQGWQPYGGLVIAQETPNEDGEYAQAMVSYKPRT